MNVTKYHWVQQYCFRNIFRIRYHAMFASWSILNFYHDCLCIWKTKNCVSFSDSDCRKNRGNLATGVDSLDFRMNPLFIVNKWLTDLLWQNFCQHVKVFSFHMKEVSLICCLGLFFVLVLWKKKHLPPLLRMFGYNIELIKTGKCLFWKWLGCHF